MPKVFKTPEESTEHVELVGVGVAGSGARGGILVEDAAVKVPELQNGGGIPLTGRELDEAAETFAEARGLEVVNVRAKDVETLPQEWGNAPEPIPAGQAATEEYQRIFGGEDEEVAGEKVVETPASEPAAGDKTKAASGSHNKGD